MFLIAAMFVQIQIEPYLRPTRWGMGVGGGVWVGVGGVRDIDCTGSGEFVCP